MRKLTYLRRFNENHVGRFNLPLEVPSNIKPHCTLGDLSKLGAEIIGLPKYIKMYDGVFFEKDEDRMMPASEIFMEDGKICTAYFRDYDRSGTKREYEHEGPFTGTLKFSIVEDGRTQGEMEEIANGTCRCDHGKPVEVKFN